MVEYDSPLNPPHMPPPLNAWPSRAPQVLLVLRVTVALLFFQHGAEKLFGFAGARAVAPENLLTMRGVGAQKCTPRAGVVDSVREKGVHEHD